MGVATLELHKEFLKLGVSSTLISTRRSDENPVDVPGVTQFVRRGPDKAFYVPGLGRRAASCIANSDVVHGHGFYVDLNRVLVGLAIESRKPLIYHAHGTLEPRILARSRRKKRLANALFENRNRDYASLWRAVTEREVASIRGLGIDRPIVVAPNGVRVEEYSQGLAQGRRSGTQKLQLLYLGRLHPIKGADLLVESWKQLEVFHDTWELVIAGPDEDGYQKTIERLITACGVADTVRLIGEVRGEAKTTRLREASALVVPSRSDGVPLVALEGMASGLPVVLSRASNLNDVEKHRAGFACDPSVDSLRQALHEVLSMSVDARVAMGQRGRSWVGAEYSWASTADKILEASESLER